MSKTAADHHRKASEHSTHVAKHHEEAYEKTRAARWGPMVSLLLRQ
jgi:hypothetical protein